MPTKPDLYREFWSRYLNRGRVEHPGWSGIGVITGRNYLEQSCSVAGCHIAPAFKRDGRVGHELVLKDRDGARNRAIFDYLRDRRQEVEDAYGRPLSWDEVPGAKRYLIGEYRPGSIEYRQEHDDYIRWLLDCGQRLRRVLDSMPADL